MFLSQVLKMTIFELKDTVHGMIPSRIMRYSLVGFLLIVSVFISSALVYLVLTNSPLAKNLVQIDKLNGFLISLLSVALFTTMLGAARNLEQPSKIRLVLLSPWLESRQLIPKMVSLLFISVIPFMLFATPFILVATLKDLNLAFILFIRSFFALMWSFIISIASVIILVSIFGREKGSKIASMAAIIANFLLIYLGVHLFSLKISSEYAYYFVFISIVFCPILILFILKKYRHVLLNSKDHLVSKEPKWGTYPWFQFLTRGKSPWIILAMFISPIITIINSNDQAYVWKSISISLTCIPLAYIINDLLSWDRANPKLWSIAPYHSRAVNQLILYQVIPIILISLAVVVYLGLAFHKINWLIATACLIPLQLPILHFKRGKILAAITTSFSVLFIFFSPIFS